MSSVNSTSAIGSSSQLSANYLNLLVTQLQNQDPLNPMDNNQMTAQLTSLSQLGQLEGLNGSFSKILLAAQMTEATGMIGKNVTFLSSDGSTQLTGAVSGVRVSNGNVTLTVGNNNVDPSTVLSVSNQVTS